MAIATTLQATAVLSGAVLSGTMMAFSFITVPVVLNGTTEGSHLYRQWLRIYNAGFPTLPIISISTCLIYLSLGLQKYFERSSWLGCVLAGLVTVLMVPFTWIFLVPTNNILMGLESKTYSGACFDIKEARALVKHWNSRHLMRSFFPLFGAVFGLVELLRVG